MAKESKLGDTRTVKSNCGKFWVEQQLTSRGWVAIGQPTPVKEDKRHQDFRQQALYRPYFAGIR